MRRHEATKRRSHEGVAAFSVALAFAAAAWAQEPPPQPEPPKPAEAQDRPPSLDELLGIQEEDSGKAAAAAADREAEKELQRHLDEEAVADAFESAIEQMGLSADLLDRKFDTGLGTQRIQEEIIRKLDQLIEFAQQQQQSSSSSSSGSKSGQPDRGQQNPGNQPPQGANAGGERSNQPSDSREGEPPPMREGDINTVLEETRTEWGNLPPRLRDELLQGRREKYSSLYERLTIEYYRRLAEEGSPE